jgi:hypothetical protein
MRDPAAGSPSAGGKFPAGTAYKTQKSPETRIRLAEESPPGMTNFGPGASGEIRRSVDRRRFESHTQKTPIARHVGFSSAEASRLHRLH